MERIKALNRYQKAVMIFMIVVALIFTVLYPLTISRVGFAYKTAILVPSRESGGTVYSGKLNWQLARFTVSEDKTVLFQYGDKTYGPYTAKYDPSAIPKDDEDAQYMTGVELRCGEDILFRGGVMDVGEFLWLYNEDGTAASFSISYTTSDGIERDENGDPIDPAEPSATDILELMEGPELTHKGEWLGWLTGVAVCVLNALTVLFADELFRFGMAFRIQDADRAEPSDLEIGGRYVSWTVLAAAALALFIVGLR